MPGTKIKESVTPVERKDVRRGMSSRGTVEKSHQKRSLQKMGRTRARGKGLLNIQSILMQPTIEAFGRGMIRHLRSQLNRKRRTKTVSTRSSALELSRTPIHHGLASPTTCARPLTTASTSVTELYVTPCNHILPSMTFCSGCSHGKKKKSRVGLPATGMQS